MNEATAYEEPEKKPAISAKERLELTARMVVPALLEREEFKPEEIVDGLDASGGFGRRVLWRAMELAAEEHGVRFLPKKGGGYSIAEPERRFTRSITRYRAGLRIFKRQEAEMKRIEGAVAGVSDRLAKVQELLIRSRARIRLEQKKKPKGL